MARARVLPTIQLMPAASSRNSPAATPVLGGPPGKNERPHPLLARTSGNPSIIMSPDHRPWTQIRLCARHAQRTSLTAHSLHRRHT